MAISLDAPNVLNFIKNNVAGGLIKQIRVKWENKKLIIAVSIV